MQGGEERGAVDSLVSHGGSPAEGVKREGGSCRCGSQAPCASWVKVGKGCIGAHRSEQEERVWVEI